MSAATKWTKDYAGKRKRSYERTINPEKPGFKRWDKSPRAKKYRECVAYKKDHIDHNCGFTKCEFREGCPTLGPIARMYTPGKKTALQHFREMI